MTDTIVDTLDDSLVVDIRRGKQRTSATQPFSVSSLKEFKEDPFKYYLKRIAREKEPQTVALVFGSAIHAGLEAFYAATDDRAAAAVAGFEGYLRENWDQVDVRTERYNPDTPWFGNAKQDFEIDLEGAAARGRAMLEPFCSMLADGWDRYTPSRIMRPVSEMSLAGAGIERRVGDVAAERGMPTAQMTLFDPQLGRMVKDMNVAIVGGVPIWGFIDLLMEWEDGTPMILDHKGVTHAVSYYGPYKAFDPSYDPATDLQLDVYGVATDITRSGFQFITKQPQFVPPSGILYNGWLDERAWKAQEAAGSLLPMAMTAGPGGAHHWITVWRPAPQDHVSRPETYTPEQVLPRVYRQLREASEQITVSNLLLERGVDPRIAFPTGSPKEIAKKACPFCHFNKQGLCPDARTKSARSEAQFRQAFDMRARLAAHYPEITERTELWRAQHASFFAQ